MPVIKEMAEKYKREYTMRDPCAYGSFPTNL
jgi:hypothetical protein